jgi:hypothetical protein
MSIQPSYIEEIEQDFHGGDKADNNFDPSEDHDHDRVPGINYDGQGQKGGFYLDNAVNYGLESNTREDNFGNGNGNGNESNIHESDNNSSALALVPRSNHEIGVESLPFSTQQQIEEERLRGDILRYLVGNSNGTYHYSAELRAIIHDVIGIPASTTQTGTALYCLPCLPCPVVHCTVLYCTTQHCAALRCAALQCTALHCTALHRTVLHCTALHCTALHCTALHCTALHCTALHCTALHCTATLLHTHSCNKPVTSSSIISWSLNIYFRSSLLILFLFRIL